MNKVPIIVVISGLCLVSAASGSGVTTNVVDVTFQPAGGAQMMVGRSINLTIWCNFTGATKPSANQFILFLAIEDSKVSTFGDVSDNDTGVIDPSRRTFLESPVTVELYGNRVGITAMTVTVQSKSGGSELRVEPDYSIRVAKPASPLNTGLRLGTVAAMSLNFLTFGCKLRYGILKRYVKNPAGIGIGFLCQYGLMPTITYVLGRVVGLPVHMAFALLAVGCAPGGGPSNLCTIVLNGDLHMSIIMTFLSTVSAIGMIPLWMYTVGGLVLRQGYPTSEINIPWMLLIVAVIWFSLPTAIGMLVARFWPRLANILILIIRPVALLFLLAQVIVFIYLNNAVLFFADSWEILFVSAATPYCAFALSFLLAFFVCRCSLKVAVTIMIETGIQNITFSFFLIIATLPQPDGEIACVVPLLVIFFTYGPILFIVFPVAAIYKRLAGRKKQRYSAADLARGLEVLAEGQEPSKNSLEFQSKPSEVSLESIHYIDDSQVWPSKSPSQDVPETEREFEGGHM